jgi:hypothetical protein
MSFRTGVTHHCFDRRLHPEKSVSNPLTSNRSILRSAGGSAGKSKGADRRAVGRPRPKPDATRAAPRAQIESPRVRRSGGHPPTLSAGRPTTWAGRLRLPDPNEAQQSESRRSERKSLTFSITHRGADQATAGTQGVGKRCSPSSKPHLWLRSIPAANGLGWGCLPSRSARRCRPHRPTSHPGPKVRSGSGRLVDGEQRAAGAQEHGSRLSRRPRPR